MCYAGDSRQGQTEQRGSQRRRPQRRASGRGLRWPERRSGFDRRKTYPITSRLRSDLTLLALVALALNALSALDLVLTDTALRLGATEANPVMRFAFEQGVWFAGALKIGVMAAVTAMVLALRRYRRVLQLAVGATAAYAFLAVYHLLGLSLL